ncbi:MAG: hypothetical protein QOI10_4399, partial [Solirubrobacterales bacterium]|nr:hypothetical protein [Solirubrobacterales bacterium]
LPSKVGFSVEPKVPYPRCVALTAARELSQYIVSDGLQGNSKKFSEVGGYTGQPPGTAGRAALWHHDGSPLCGQRAGARSWNRSRTSDGGPAWSPAATTCRMPAPAVLHWVRLLSRCQSFEATGGPVTRVRGAAAPCRASREVVAVVDSLRRCARTYVDGFNLYYGCLRWAGFPPGSARPASTDVGRHPGATGLISARSSTLITSPA